MTLHTDIQDPQRSPVFGSSASMQSWRRALLPLTLWVVACGGAGGPDGDGSGNTLQTRPVINVEAGDRLVAHEGTVLVSPYGAAATRFWISNAGDAPLSISDVRLATGSAPELSIVAADLPATVSASDPQSRWGFDIVVSDIPASNSVATGEVVVTTNHQRNGETEFRATLRVEISPPQIVVPALMDLGTVASGSSADRVVTLTNAGVAPLVVTHVSLDAPTSFDWAPAAAQTESVAGAARVGRDLHFSPSWVIAPGSNGQLTVVYGNDDPAPASGDLRIFSNDPSTPEAVVALQANVGGPCIAVSSNTVAFGGKYVGTEANADISITSCGDEALVISHLGLAQGGADSFAVGLEDTAFPIELPVNKTITIPVTFVPAAVAEVVEGAPVRDEAVFEIVANTVVPERSVSLSGWGVDTLCPSPVISIAEGEEVIPQTLLHLDGTQSFAAQGNITDYAWEVTAPNGSVDVLLPSAGAPQPTFRANIVGLYTFVLKVRDADGQWSDGSGGCMPATANVVVVSDELIHVELLWHTPADPDETDTGSEAGADLDLHFLHPFAFADGGDGWFHPVFDAYWFNDSPNWNNYQDALDDPGLDRDDTDGGGPENVNLDAPETGISYKIGVHYWNDHSFGKSEATVRIYIHSTLVFERSGVNLWPDDMWDVADIAWPSGQVTENLLPDGAFDIIANYPKPF